MLKTTEGNHAERPPNLAEVIAFRWARLQVAGVIRFFSPAVGSCYQVPNKTGLTSTNSLSALAACFSVVGNPGTLQAKSFRGLCEKFSVEAKKQEAKERKAERMNRKMDKLGRKFGRVEFVKTFEEAEKLAAVWIRERKEADELKSWKVQILHNRYEAFGKWKVQETETFDFDKGGVHYVR